MKKKLLCGVFIIALLLCLYFVRTDRASGADPAAADGQADNTEQGPPPPRVLPDAAPDPEEAPAFIDGQYTSCTEDAIRSIHTAADRPLWPWS